MSRSALRGVWSSRNNRQNTGGLRTRLAKSRLRRAAAACCQALERRTLFTTTVFLDFGDNFPGGGLTGTVEDLRDDVNGPDFADGNSPGVDDDTVLTFTRFATTVTNQNIDYDTDGDSDAADASAVRAAVISLVQRYYAPLDVTVAVSGVDFTGAADFDDISDTLDANSGSGSGENDAYTLIAGVTTDGSPIVATLNGQAGGDDIGDENDDDDTCVAIANNVLSGINGFDADTQVGYTAAHEAAHTLSLEHTNKGGSAGSDNDLLTRSDMIVGSARNTNRVNIDFFTRFDLPTDSGSPATQNSYGKLAGDDDIGARSGFPAYVTGTGAFDKITLSSAGPGLVNVSVQAHRDTTYANQIASTSYVVASGNGILVEAGFSADQVILNANINANVTVRGMNGNDQLIVMGNNAAGGSFTPGGATSVGFDGNTYLSGTLVAGGSTITLQEYVATASVQVQDITSFTYVTPNGADTLATDTPAAGQTRISGTSGGVALLPLTYFNVANLTLDTAANDGGSADDSVTLDSAAANGLTTLAVNTGAGDDTLTVDFSPANPVPSGGLTYNGGSDGGGSDLLVLRGGSFTNEVYTASGPDSGTISLDGTTNIAYSNLSPINDSVTVTNLTFNATANADTIQLENSPLASRSRIRSANGTFELLDFANKTNVTVNALGGGDTFNLTATTVPPGLSTLTLNGGADGDTVNVTRSLGGGVATTVNGDGGNDRINVTGSGLAAGGTVAFNGNADDDTFDVTSSPDVAIPVDGGSGNDTLKVNGQTLTYAFTTVAAATTFTTAGRQPVTSTLVELLDVRNGTFTVTNNVTPSVRVQGVEDGPATLNGTGIIAGTLRADPGGTVSPAVGAGVSGILGAGSTTLNAGSTYFVDLNGIVAGTDHDQLNVTGTVTINNADLAGTLNYASIPGEELVIIRNDGADAVTGKFIQGDLIEIGGKKFAIDYAFDGDGDGNLNDVALIRYGAELAPDPCDPTKTALFVSATTGDDNVLALPVTGSSRVRVVIEAVTQGFTDNFGPFDFDGQIIMMGQSGNDLVSTEAVPSRDVMLYGNVGNDHVVGGNNNGILLGNLGDDTLVGGNARDVMIGGKGADNLTGYNAGDVLVAASTTYDTNTVANRQALCEIMHTWQHGGRMSGLLNAATVNDDTEVDILTGGEGVDWFVRDLNDILDAAKNEVTSDL